MEQQFDAVLTGSDTPVEGVATAIDLAGYSSAYEFNAIDETIHLVIGRNPHGKWERVAGTEPYFAGWVDELAEQAGNTTPMV